MKAAQRLLWLLGLLLLPGCHSGPDSSDLMANGFARDLIDPEPPRSADSTSPAHPASQPPTTPAAPDANAELQPLAAAVAQKEPKLLLPPRPVKPPLVIPPGLPGTNAPPIVWPKDPAEREKAIKKLYPPLPPLPEEVPALPGPDGQPLTLSDLQRLAAANNPSIKNALAGIEAARGAARQAGAYPNPTVAWEADTVGTTGAGYQGAWVDQIIKGGNDLKLKTAAAVVDLRNAHLALRKARSDLATQVRTNYFAVLVASENIRASRALARFTEQVYRVQVDLLGAGVAAPYEPMQLRPLALQARFNLTQARNQYQGAWRQLAAALGLPNMPPTNVAGRVDLPVPVFEYDAVREQVLNQHTDVLTALNNVQKARYLMELARVAPFPDFDARVLVQKDYSTPPFLLVYSAVLGFQLPVWDLNRGNLYQARSQLTQAYQAPQQTKLQLTGNLADAFNRYLTAKEQVQISMQQIQDQVRVYRGVYERHTRVFPPEVTFGDVVTAQQMLGTYIGNYITALGLQWTAVVDIAGLLQTDDLFQVQGTQHVFPIPDLEQLLQWPCLQPAAASRTAAAGSEGAAGRPVTLLHPRDPETTPAPAGPARLGPVLTVTEAPAVTLSAPAPDR